ncbi:MAG: hypothetical protein KAX31_04015, partial [Thermoplasmata archaeon]|nr:hypothetical protein [Thermoplasmata archaeon]
MKQKITVGIIAFAIISVSVAVGVSVNVNAISFIEDIPGVIPWGPSFEPKDIAWDDAGSMAVVVGKEMSVGPHAWIYFPGNTSWFPIDTGADDQTLTGVCWDRGVNNRFYFCGLADGSTTIASVYYIEPQITLTAQLPNLAPYDNFNGISCDSGGNPAVVCSFSFIQYFSWEGNTWNLFNDWDGVFTEVELYSIDYSTTLNRFVAVGCFGGSQGILMYTDQGPYVPWPGTIYTYKDHTVPLEMPFNAVAMNNLQSGGLVVGHTVYRVIFSTVGKGPDLTTTWELIEGEEWIEDSFITEYRDVEWDNTYTEAAIVGQRWNTGLPGYEGYYWRLYAPPSLNLVNVYGNGILDEPYSCVGFKPPSSPRWFMIPSASGGIRVNVDASDM